MSGNLKKKFSVKTDVLDSERKSHSFVRNEFDQKSSLKVVNDPEVSNYSSGDDTLNNFELKSEYIEKNVNLKKPTQEEMEQPIRTNVTVYRENSVETVSAGELKEIIKTCKDIKQVIIEKISVKEATKISLLYEPKLGELSERKKSLTNKLSFNKKENSENKVEQVQTIEQVKPSVEVKRPGEVNRNESTISKTNFKEFESSLNEDFLLNSPLESEVDSNVENFDTPDMEKKVFTNLELKTESELDSEAEIENKNVEYSKHTLTRKKGRQHNGYYYKAKDHMELFKVGSSFLKDFRNGLKNFSFSSFELQEEREKTVFGISSFFNYHSDIKMVIVTSSIRDSFYGKFVKNLEVEEKEVLDEGLKYKVYKAKGFDIIEFAELGKVERRMRLYDFEYFLDDFVDCYDLVLWDLPEVSILDTNKELYFPIIRVLDNVSLIVAGNKTKIKEINELIGYFQRYQIKIKGLLFSQGKSSPYGRAA